MNSKRQAKSNNAEAGTKLKSRTSLRWDGRYNLQLPIIEIHTTDTQLIHAKAYLGILEQTYGTLTHIRGMASHYTQAEPTTFSDYLFGFMNLAPQSAQEQDDIKHAIVLLERLGARAVPGVWQRRAA